MKAPVLAFSFAVAACAAPGSVAPQAPVVSPPEAPPGLDPRMAPRDALVGFLDAAEAGRFGDALACLATPLRARYSAERLEADFVLEPLAKERLARARRALGQGTMSLEDAAARLPLDNGRQLRLVREAEGWKLAALEE